MDGHVLPDAMPSERHEVVHAIVGFRHAVEDACDPVRLLRLGQPVLEPEMCRSRAGIAIAVVGRSW